MERWYDRLYLKRREFEVDKSEWIDIYHILKANRISRDAKIVDLGAGSGGLIRFLRSKGFKHVYGVDLLYHDEYVIQLDLEKSWPPEADVYVFQHFLEHIDQDRARELLKHCYDVSYFIIGILPGHYSRDPTHVVNHYDLGSIYEFVDYIQPRNFYVTVDTLSYINPLFRDFILIISKNKINIRFRPLSFKLLHRFNHVLFRRLWRP